MTPDRKISTSDIANAADRDVHRRDEQPSPRADTPRPDERPAPLFVDADAAGYRTRWDAIQTGFVDEPRKAVEEADALVAQVMTRLAEGFAEERRQLEAQWEHRAEASTEDLRQAMRRYRSFFERLLSV